MRIIAGLAFTILLAASPAWADGVAPLTSKDVDALSPGALTARLLPLMDKTYTGKIRVPTDPNLPHLLTEFWLTGPMAPLDQGLCAAKVLDVTFDLSVTTGDPAHFDPPLAPSRIETQRRYVFVGAPRVYGAGAQRNAAVQGLDCSSVPWPSTDGTFTAETGILAANGIILLLQAKDDVHSGSPRLDVVCDETSAPCGDMRAIIDRIGMHDIRHIAACHAGALPMPREFCALIALGPNDARLRWPAPDGGLTGWWLRLDSRDGHVTARFRAPPPGEEVYEWWTF